MSGMKDLLGDEPYSATYPDNPGFKERGGTSEQAAQSMTSSAATLRDLVHDTLKRESMTADEVATRLGKSILSIRPRLSELRAKGMIIATGRARLNESGKPAQVWMAV
jgi:predicted ArsR family transcriptional regulator